MKVVRWSRTNLVQDDHQPQLVMKTSSKTKEHGFTNLSIDLRTPCRYCSCKQSMNNLRLLHVPSKSCALCFVSKVLNLFEKRLFIEVSKEMLSMSANDPKLQFPSRERVFKFISAVRNSHTNQAK